MCAKWNAVSNFTWEEGRVAGVTWAELGALSDENAVKFLQAKLAECHPQNENQKNLKSMLSAFLIGIASSFTYDALKILMNDNLSSTLRIISQIIYDTFDR